MSQEKYSRDEAEALTYNCGQCSAEGAGLETYYEDTVQNDVQSSGNSDEYEGVSGVPHAPENAAYGVIAIDEHKTQNAGETVIFCLLKGFRRGIHPVKDVYVQKRCDHSHDNRKTSHADGKSADEAAHVLSLPRSDVLGDYDSPGIGEAHGQEGQQIVQVSADRYR